MTDSTASFLAAMALALIASGSDARSLQMPTSAAAEQQTPSATDDSKQNPTRLYVIRVIDGTSRSPVKKAKVWVELENRAKTRWAGSTDSNGIFQFRWDASPGHVRAHIEIRAPGYMTLVDRDLLMEDTLIDLNKAD